MIKISKSGLRNGNPLELLRLAWLLNQSKLQNEFKKVGIDVKDDNSLVAISELIKQGIDTSGQLQMNGNPVMFNATNMINGLTGYTQAEKDVVLINTNNFTN